MGKRVDYYVELENKRDGEIITCSGNGQQVVYIGKGLDKTKKTKGLNESMHYIESYVKQLEAIGYRVTHRK